MNTTTPTLTRASLFSANTRQDDPAEATDATGFTRLGDLQRGVDEPWGDVTTDRLGFGQDRGRFGCVA